MMAVMDIFLGLLTALFLIVLASLIAAPLIEAETSRRPTMNFYSAEAYDDCGAMSNVASAQGFTRWVCHKPTEHQQ